MKKWLKVFPVAILLTVPFAASAKVIQCHCNNSGYDFSCEGADKSNIVLEKGDEVVINMETNLTPLTNGMISTNYSGDEVAADVCPSSGKSMDGCAVYEVIYGKAGSGNQSYIPTTIAGYSIGGSVPSPAVETITYKNVSTQDDRQIVLKF